MSPFTTVELAASSALKSDYRLSHQELIKYFNRELHGAKPFLSSEFSSYKIPRLHYKDQPVNAIDHHTKTPQPL